MSFAYRNADESAHSEPHQGARTAVAKRLSTEERSGDRRRRQQKPGAGPEAVDYALLLGKRAACLVIGKLIEKCFVESRCDVRSKRRLPRTLLLVVVADVSLLTA